MSRRRRNRKPLLILIALALLVLWGIGTQSPRKQPEVVPPPPVAQAPLSGPVDRIVIDKSTRRMTAFRGDHALKTYRIALGFAPEGDKMRQGDGKTPEGVFRINRRNDRSAYHLSLGIDYPQADDQARARLAGVNPGGDIFIHGQPNQLPDGITVPGDWTAGCIAVTDAEIEELFAATPMGAVVEIRP